MSHSEGDWRGECTLKERFQYHQTTSKVTFAKNKQKKKRMVERACSRSVLNNVAYVLRAN